MSSNPGDGYIRAEERIYEVAVDKDNLDWRNFLYELIHKEGLDPWDVDLGILTKKYLSAIRDIGNVDFDVSGKFLTIAVFLLKVKAENYIDRDLRGMDEKIAAFKDEANNLHDSLDALEGFDDHLENVNTKRRKREQYSIKVRNPMARKRKVNIFDLIKVLEKTFEQSNKRRANFFARARDNGDYEGPMYEKKEKDLKEIIEELYDIIIAELGEKKAHVTFSHLSRGVNHRQGILEKFIPLLHLHNQSRVTLKQNTHFGEIEIHKINKEQE